MNQPLVSIIIPIKDRFHLLTETLKSVKAQTYTNCEIIIVDDHSKENFELKIRGIVGAIPCRYLVNPQPSGCGYSRQKGLEASSGKYVIYLDSDDILHPAMAGKCVEYMERCPDLGMCYVTTREFRKLDDLKKIELLKIRRRSDQRITDNIIHEILTKRKIWETASCCWKKEAVLNFEWTRSWSEDYAYDIQAETRGLRIGHIAQTLCFYRNHEESISKKVSNWAVHRLNLLGLALRYIEASEHIDSNKKEKLKKFIFFQYVKWRLRVPEPELESISEPQIKEWNHNSFLNHRWILRLLQKISVYSHI